MGCQKDLIIQTKTDISPFTPVSLCYAHLSGFVVDENLIPIDNVQIKSREAFCSSNDNGFFSINNLFLGSSGDVLSFKKDGYFNSYTSVYPLANQKMNIQVEMVSKPAALRVNPTETITLPLGKDGALIIPAYSLQTMEGSLVFSDVKVYLKELSSLCNSLCSPVNREISFEEQKSLLLDWLVLLSIEDDQGNKLDLVPGNKITLRLPTTYSGQTPYYYRSALWEAISSKSGQFFTLSSLPNRLSIGKPYEYVLLTGQIQPQKPFNYTTFSQTVFIVQNIENRHTIASVLSSTSGYFVLPVITQKSSSLIISDVCSQMVSRKTLPAYSTNPDSITSFLLDDSQISSETRISGFVKNIAGAAVTNGLISVLLDNGTAYKQKLNHFGSYFLSMPNCDAKSMQISIYDLDSMKYFYIRKPTSSNFSLSPKLTLQMETYISVQVDSTVPFVFHEPTISYNKQNGQLSMQNNTCCSFGMLNMKYQESSTLKMPLFSFVSFSEEHLIFQPSKEELHSVYSDFSILKDRPSFIEGQIKIVGIRDVRGFPHFIVLHFRVNK